MTPPEKTGSNPARSPFAAVVYRPRSDDRSPLSAFVDALKKEGVHVGGIVQETFIMPDGEMRGIDAVDIETGQHIPINRPTREEWDNRVCSLDASALAETSTILDRTMEHRPDLMVIEKFGNREKKGKGLADEIFRVIAADIPLLIAVPETLLDIWSERSGNLGDILPLNEKSLRTWWEKSCGKKSVKSAPSKLARN